MTVTGDVLAGRYRLVRLVASGGMGSVWEGWDELLQRRVAIKELLTPPGVSWDDAATARSRVIREGRITARLHHPNAVTLFDVIDHGGQPCLVLQFVPSRTLSSMLAERKVLPAGIVAGVGAEVASALAAAHRVGIVHRDVKPSNVLITGSGTAMITDFGISHAAGDISLTSTGMVSGTPAFLAPEVARGAESGFPADVFSLGATLYAALEGTPPFGADQNAMAVLHKVATGQVIPPRRSGALTPLLLQMLIADPAGRPAMPTVARLLNDLMAQMSSSATAGSDLDTVAVAPRTVREWPVQHDATGGQTPSPALRLATGAAPARRRPRRRRLAVLAMTAAATLLLLAGVAVWLLAGGTGHAKPAVAATSNAAAPVLSPITGHSFQTVSPADPSTPATWARSIPPSAATKSAPPAPVTSRSQVVAPGRRSSNVQAPTAPHRTVGTTAAPTDAATTTPGPSTSGPAAAPTAAQLAAAITDYYAVLPTNTDQGWAQLTSNFQTGIAQNRQYYQHFWDSIRSVTATKAHGAAPDTAEATITYHFKDGRTAVEITVYDLVLQGGALKIDNSTVLSSTTQ